MLDNTLVLNRRQLVKSLSEGLIILRYSDGEYLDAKAHDFVFDAHNTRVPLMVSSDAVQGYLIDNFPIAAAASCSEPLIWASTQSSTGKVRAGLFDVERYWSAMRGLFTNPGENFKKAADDAAVFVQGLSDGLAEVYAAYSNFVFFMKLGATLTTSEYLRLVSSAYRVSCIQRLVDGENAVYTRIEYSPDTSNSSCAIVRSDERLARNTLYRNGATISLNVPQNCKAKLNVPPFGDEEPTWELVESPLPEYLSSDQMYTPVSIEKFGFSAGTPAKFGFCLDAAAINNMVASYNIILADRAKKASND